MSEIEGNDCDLNISRYVSTAEADAGVDHAATHAELVRLDAEIRAVTAQHNVLLKELELPLLQ